MSRQWRFGRAGVMLAALLVPLAIQAQDNNWVWTSGDSNWVNTANWSLGHAPIAGEIAVINNAKVTLTNDTADLGGLIVTNGAILSVYSPGTNGATQWGLLVSVSGTLTVADNAWINPYSHYTNGGSVWFRCLDLVVATNSGFDANEKGYSGGIYALGGYNPKGYGPGGSVGSTYSSGGGGYGGQGGTGFDGPYSAPGGSPYGDYMNPSDPGSGAGGAQVGNGKMGGGLVHIEAADSVLIDGSILANGQDGPGYPGAGSGGGICIKCRTFGGSGLLKAVGGDDIRNTDWRNGGAGGGGRIAVLYDTTAQAGVSPQPTVRFNAAGGSRRVSVTTTIISRQSQGRPGSLYLSDNQFFAFSEMLGGEIKVPGVTSWTANSLSLTNDLIAFPSGFTLTVSQDVSLANAAGIDLSNSVVSIGGDLVINSDRRASAYFRGGPGQQISIGTNINITKGWVDVDLQGMTNTALGLSGSLLLDDATLNFRANQTNTSSLNVAGHLLATNSALVFLYSGITNGSPDYSLLVDVAGDMTIASNCWVYPYSHFTNGGSALFRVSGLKALAGGGIDASEKGFAGGIYAIGGYNAKGFGPGGGIGWTMGSSGAGYGGEGGYGPVIGVPGGSTYGSSNAPIDPGSGGGEGQVAGYGGYGGGLIRIEAEKTVIVDGSLLANGGQAVGNNYASPGSGGAIYIRCRDFTGAPGGTLRANGVDGRASGFGNSGSGGGRIAVWYKSTNNWFGSVQVNGGLKGNNPTYIPPLTDGTNGTVVWMPVTTLSGTIMLVK